MLTVAEGLRLGLRGGDDSASAALGMEGEQEEEQPALTEEQLAALQAEQALAAEEDAIRAQAEAAVWAKAQAKRDATRQQNEAVVAFSKPTVKHICNPHRGSILATPEPDVPLADELREKAVKVFGGLVPECPAEVSQKLICDLLVECGYDSDRDILERIVEKKFFTQGEADIESKSSDVGAFMDASDFCNRYLQRFQAPSYYYGQRLRRNAGRGEVQEMLELIVRGCSINTADGEGLTSLHYASEFNRLDVIKALVGIGGSADGGRKILLDARDKYGWTPLYCAVHHGNSDAVALLLQAGAGLAVANKLGKTPMHEAAAQNRMEIAVQLLAAGASVVNVDENKFTPLHEAAFKGYSDIFAYLAAQTKENISLMRDVIGLSPLDYGAVERPALAHETTTSDPPAAEDVPAEDTPANLE